LGGARRVAQIAAITCIAAATGQLLPLHYDLVGLLLGLGASGAVWLALAAVLVRDDLGRMSGMVWSLMPGRGR
jgi:membrane associated rhomboid family serine protease